MKADITIPMKKADAKAAIKAIKGGQLDSKRVKTTLKASSKGLEIHIKASDVASIKAGVNTTLKLYQVHKKVKENAKRG